MHKKVTVFLFFCSIFLGFSQNTKNQKIYEFDYILEYESYNSHTKKKSTRFRLVNSKNGNYFSSIMELNNKEFRVFFSDIRKLSSQSKIVKEDFFSAKTIDLSNNYSYSNYYHSTKSEKFKLEKLNDTVIDDKNYEFYRFYKKRSSKSGRYFALQKIEDFNYLWNVQYKEYVKMKPEIICANGVNKIEYSLDENGSYLEGYSKLVNYQKVKKFISIDISDKN